MRKLLIAIARERTAIMKITKAAENRKSEKQEKEADQRSTIITMIRRGDSISKISNMLHVRRNEVEKIMDWYVERMMA